MKVFDQSLSGAPYLQTPVLWSNLIQAIEIVTPPLRLHQHSPTYCFLSAPPFSRKDLETHVQEVIGAVNPYLILVFYRDTPALVLPTLRLPATVLAADVKENDLNMQRPDHRLSSIFPKHHNLNILRPPS